MEVIGVKRSGGLEEAMMEVKIIAVGLKGGGGNERSDSKR
jgi:hypothetical protein